jgi:hypothetical protein
LNPTHPSAIKSALTRFIIFIAPAPTIKVLVKYSQETDGFYKQLYPWQANLLRLIYRKQDKLEGYSQIQQALT